MSIRYTRRLLRDWGKWAAGGLQGFPRMSAFMRLQMGTRSVVTQTAPEIVQCDKTVARAELEMRQLLIRHYCGIGTAREKAARMHLSRHDYYDLLSDATWWVHTELERVAETHGTCYQNPPMMAFAIGKS